MKRRTPSTLRFLLRLRRQQEGVAALEFALSVPLILMLLAGGMELSHYMIIQQKAEKVAYTVADLVGQTEAVSLSTTTLNNILEAAGQEMLPFTFGNKGRVFISSVTKTGTNAPVVNWQHSGGGTYAASSQVGNPSYNASLPVGFTMADKENIIITEVYFRYTSLFGSYILPTTTFYKTAYYKPRLGALSGAPSS